MPFNFRPPPRPLVMALVSLTMFAGALLAIYIIENAIVSQLSWIE
jgi:hypothetical protein